MMDERDPLYKHRQVFKVFVFAILAYILICMVACSKAKADDSLILNGQTILHITRPVSVLIVEALPANIEGCENRNYACSPNAFGKGRCIIYIKPQFLGCLFHEQQHCMGEKHGHTPSGDSCALMNFARS